MRITRYEIHRYTAEITVRTARDLSKLVPGCTAYDPEPETISSHDNVRAAQKALDHLSSDIHFIDSFYGGKLAEVTEYAIEEAVYSVDEDGNEEEVSVESISFTSFPTELSFGCNDYEYNLLSGWTLVADEDEDEE